ncbi:flagellar basal body P-ring formation chaperone FlgA [Roseateles sp. BYS78W]|uniref:Flagella basal body P-ring formation protein FlgA n=1 Tax=Pelomonas candidula TaxID=3299025 RepID=A0ABW7HGT5_9BURK
MLSSIVVSAAAQAVPASLDDQVLEFTRRALLDQAQRSGFIAPEVQLSLPALRAQRPACPAGWDIGAEDLGRLLRLHVVARCADGRTPPQDYLLRGTLSAEVLVVLRGVAPGQPLAEADVELQRRDISTMPDAVSGLAAVAELVPRASLRAGQVLQQRLLQAQLLVRRGEAVRIVANRDGIDVQAAGEALDSGARGAAVKVRNSASGRVIVARVVDAGVVAPADR